MLRSLNAIRGYRLAALDGDLGRCHDFLFDDQKWVIRYMVADTRAWLPGRKVLVSPMALGEPDWSQTTFPVSLTRDQIRESPPLEADAPVSKRQELEALEHFGWDPYWIGPHHWGVAVTPAVLRARQRARVARHVAAVSTAAEQPNLRSVKEVLGYRASATDGEVGKIDDLIVDDECWAISYLVVRTGVLPPKRVVLSAQWLDSMNWAERTASIALRSDQVRQAPEYDPAAPVNRKLVAEAYDFHGRPLGRVSSSPDAAAASTRESITSSADTSG